MQKIIFSGLAILQNKKWLQQHAVIVENNKIIAIIPEQMLEHHLPAKQYHFQPDYYLIPGLIDLHIHGLEGHDVMDSSLESLLQISFALAKRGVTGFLATTMTAANAAIENILQLIPQAMLHAAGAKILGVHLEGPFIATKKQGAQSGQYAQHPNIQLIEKWQNLAKNTIKLLTLAPELPGSLPFISSITNRGIIACIGHSNATFAETENAIKAGCSYATHLFNAMSPLHHREPGASGAILLAEEVMAELIVDGHHVHPAMIDIAIKVKGIENLLLVSDAMRACGMNDGEYDLGGKTVLVKSSVATLADGTLAGSTLSLMQAIKNIVNQNKVSLAEAVAMASLHPAKILRLLHKGEIAVNNDADLVVLNENLEPVLTLCAGIEVFNST